MAKRNAGGRPPKYTSKEQIEGLIEQYFQDCEGHILTNEQTGQPVLDKWGFPVYVDRHPPTVTGLALALGFATRISLLDYQGKAEFRDTILRAKSRIEQYTEERLFDKDGANGAKFSLQNNFRRWKEDKGDEAKVPSINIVCDIPKAAAEVEQPAANAKAGEAEDDAES